MRGDKVSRILVLRQVSSHLRAPIISVFFILMLIFSSRVLADDDSSGAAESATGTKFPRGRIELKRQATNRGTPEETTKTQLKIDAYLEGFVSLLRLEAPFPDEKTDFEGDPFNPRLGDIKVRVGFHPFPVEDIPVSTFVEVTFPTASPEDLGSGKYQLTGGIQPNFKIPLSEALSQSNAMTFSPLVKQVVSVGGDENRKNINYTQFELALRDVWEKKYWLKLTPKPVIDWEQDGKTGAVLELEIGWIINRNWSTWLMLGTQLWGEGVPSTYDKRVELGVAYLF
ncbi:MAG TPA: hypothetical protein VMB77_03710 [Syntrophales bacterium]|nr:hypothetical protein [Syntrophales bacterium]